MAYLSSRSYRRAALAVRCSPLTPHLFERLRVQSVPLLAIAGRPGLQAGYTRWERSVVQAEDDLVWLIQVGVLRREVDGQGITDSFRLTPLGQAVVSGVDWRQPITWWARLEHWAIRWLRWPG